MFKHASQSLALSAIALFAAANSYAQSRAQQLEKLGDTDLQIQVATRQVELRRLLEQIQPGYQLPTFKTIYGSAGNMKAILVTPLGSLMTVSAGDRITNGVVVSAINDSGVDVKVGNGKNSKIVPLELAQKPPPPGTVPQPVQRMPLPQLGGG